MSTTLPQRPLLPIARKKSPKGLRSGQRVKNERRLKRTISSCFRRICRKVCSATRDTTPSKQNLRTVRLENFPATTGYLMPERVARTDPSIIVKGRNHADTPPHPRHHPRRARHPALRHRNGPGRDHAKDFAPV